MAYNQQNPYGGYNSYEQQNPYGESYEMSNTDDFGVFMKQIRGIEAELESYQENVLAISRIQQRLLNEVSTDQIDILTKSLDDLNAEQSVKSRGIKNAIQECLNAAGNDEAKVQQAESVKKQFMDLIQEYRSAEARYKEESKEVAVQQYQIIRPEATEQEIEAALEDSQGTQIFSQALLNSSRRGDARNALVNVQARHSEVQKLTRQMAELLALFEDMQNLVAEQQEGVQQIEANVQNAQHDIEQGTGEAAKAVVSARKARKKRLWCLLIIIIIIIIIVVGVAVPLATR